VTKIALSLLALAALYPATAGVVVIGNPPDAGTGNCYPFGCTYSGEYQQVYTASAFTGPITISGLEFFNTQYNSGATSTPTGNYAISLSTTSADWNTLSPTFASNIGGDNTEVFNASIEQSWAFGDTLTITFSTPFSYNPGNGNLLLDVVTDSSIGTGVYFDTNGNSTPNTILGRVYCDDCTSNGVDNGYGLVTGFVTGSSTPEPGTMTLAALGLLGTLALRRRRS